MKKIKGILVTGDCVKASVVEVEHSVDSFHKLIDCDCIDITSRFIGGKRYYIVCDDEGLLRHKRPSAFYTNGIKALVGNLFIVAFDGVDDICSLTYDDISHIFKFILFDILILDI